MRNRDDNLSMERSLSRAGSRRGVLPFAVMAAGLIVLLVAVLALDSSKLELEEHSEYSHIRIRKKGSVRALLFVRDTGREVVESRIDLDAPHELLLPYSSRMFTSYLFLPRQERVLIVGLGGGAMVHFLRHHEPDLHVDAVEIDPVVVRLADEYFGTRSEGNVRILTADGFDYLESTEERYDVIYMDAFLKPSEETDDTGIPQRLKTLAFYESMKGKLRPDGLVVFNLNRSADTEHDIETIETAFAHSAVFRCPPSRNTIVIGATSSERPGPAELVARAKRLDERFHASFSFERLLSDRID